jgi:hypothetical protein
VDRACLLAKIQ